jgi:hypothetical protein
MIDAVVSELEMAGMWSLTPDNLAQARSELKVRRAAVEARYAAELKDIDTDLEEIETLERVAKSFSVKYLSEADVVSSKPAEGTGEPAAASPEENVVAEAEPVEPTGIDPAPEGTEEPQPLASTADLSTAPESGNAIAKLRSSPIEPAVSPDTATKGSLRWRIRIPSEDEIASQSAS